MSNFPSVRLCFSTLMDGREKSRSSLPSRWRPKGTSALPIRPASLYPCGPSQKIRQQLMITRRKAILSRSSPTARLFLASAILDRKSVVEGKSVSVRVDLGGGRIIKKKKIKQ